MKFSTTLTLAAATALMSTGTNARIGDGRADYTSDDGLSKTVTNDIGAIAKTDTEKYVAASKTVTDNIGAVAKADTEEYVAALKTTTDNIGAVAKADTAEYVAASKSTTDTFGAVAKADTADDVTASKINDISTNTEDYFVPPETAIGGYEVYAINCFKKTVGAIFFLEEDIDMEAMDNNTGEIFVKEGDCKYVGHTTLERPKFDVIGQDVDVKGLAWPDAWQCKDMGNTAPIFLGDTLCGKHAWPSNACFVDLC